MDSELWKRVEPVLDRALELDGAEREAYLAGVFEAEPELRAEVESLIAADEQADGVLDRAIEAPGLDLLPPESSAEEGGVDSAEPRVIGPYRLLREIGSGGMGVVYEAEDTRLQRRVALKFLPQERRASHSQLARFQREAKGLARLNHPHIVTLYSVEEHDGAPFITMELVEGVTLASLVPAEGLPLDRCLSTAIALSDALVAAHQRDIVHRDLKPANVMVTPDGWVKVLDFGLAKLADPQPPGASGGTTEYKTAAGAVMGTVPYMSPEQLEGKEVDHRTDIFSFGAVLYEMVTGQRPFDGDSSASIISAILRDAPLAPGELRSDLPDELGGIIDRCLEKKVERRYSDASELRGDLEKLKLGLDSDALLASRARATRQKRPWLIAAALAVVVGVAGVGLWRSRSDDRSQPTDPSQTGPSDATAVPTDAAAEAQEQPPPTENLEAYFEYQRGVRSLAGISSQGDWLRAIAHFERAVELDPDFTHAWAKLSIYRVMAASRGAYPRDERAAMVEASVRESERALELAADDPMARLTIGYHYYYVDNDFDRAHEVFSSAIEESADDLDIDILLLKAMAAIQRRRGEFEESLEYWERALRLDPNDAEAVDGAIGTYIAVRNNTRAAQLLDRQIAENPSVEELFVLRAWVEVKRSGSLERARTFLDQSSLGDESLLEIARYERDWPRHLAALAEIKPARLGVSLAVWHLFSGLSHRHLGEEDEARKQFESAFEVAEEIFLQGDVQAGNAPLLRGLALAYLGRKREALRAADSLPNVFGSEDHFSGPMMGEKKAELLAVAGDADRAIDQLERMLSVAYANAITHWDLRLDPIWDPLREHPRFQALVTEDG